MAHTNSTENYRLPQFINTDKPAWLTDVNNAYAAIDTAIKSASDAAGAAATQAATAQAATETNADAITALQNTVASVTTEQTATVTLDPAVASGNLVIHSYGKLIQLEGTATPVNHDQYVTIHTLTSVLRPNETLYSPGVGFGGATGTPHIRVRATGQLEVYVPTAGEITFSCVYMIRE